VEADGRCRSMVATATESYRSTVAAAIESFPLASAPYVIDSVIRVCGVLCGHDKRWFPCPRHTLLYGAVREGPTATRTADAPDQGADGDPSINKRSPS
jgi:hypothetical protein